MAYASASDVAGLTKNILDGATMFSDTTVPDMDTVTNWLSTGCGVIETKVSGYGYSVPPASGTGAWDTLKELNILFAAAYVELARINITLAPGERTRGQVFRQMYEDALADLEGTDLSRVGFTRSADGKLYVGGISVTDKQTQETDTDRVSPRFTRRQMQFPETSDPSDAVTAS